ncbi:MAG: AAA family ATPase [Nitrospirae bacterium]|nr:AAA family ATPase [Nitrospirota bacterium]
MDGGGSGLNPFYEDTKTAFNYYKNGNFYDFGKTEYQGDIIDFHMFYYNLTLSEAVADLERIYDGANGGDKSTRAQANAPVRWSSKENVDRAHNALISNHAKLKEIEDRYGLTYETITRYKIGLISDKFTTPIDMGGGNYNLKQHKGVQVKGTTAQLYPSDVRDKVIAGNILSVVIAEGEFKALLLNQMGIAAISGTAGAGTFLQAWANCFKGADVITFYDNDKGGWDGTSVVAGMLDGIANNVKSIVWPPEAEGMDVTDLVVKLGYTPDDLRRLIDKAVPVVLPTKEGQIDLCRALVSIRDIRGMEISQDYICDKILPAQSISLFSGAGGVGKSTFALLLAEAIAQGKPFLGCSTIPRPVIYVDFENSMPTINERAKRYELDSFHVWHTSSEIPPPRIDDKAWELYKQLPQGAVLIFDTLRACQNGDENSSQDMQKVMSRFKELRDMGFTIVLLHHTAKGDGTRYKGSTAIQDLADHSVVLQKLKRGTDNEIFDDKETDIQYKLCTKDKTRYAPFSIFLEFEINRGFYVAEKDPREEYVEGISEIIKSLSTNGEYPLQKDIKKLAKQDLDIGKDMTLNVLKYGEGKYWRSEQAAARQSKRYLLINEFLTYTVETDNEK